MPQWGITVTEEMDEAMKRVVDARGSTISATVRQLVEKFLAESGEQVVAKVRWGGKRQPQRKPQRKEK